MKISLSWLFDYIDYPVSKVDVDTLVHLFNTRTAEIEHFEKSDFSFKSIFIGKIQKKTKNEISLFCEEIEKDITLPFRENVEVGQCFLIIKKGVRYSWVTFADLKSDKESLFPAISLKKVDLSGGWRKKIEQVDYILDVDNKSINHRPDLWGHYGIAREVAASFGYKLKPLSKILIDQKVSQFDKKSIKSLKTPFSIKIEAVDNECSRFAGFYADNVKHQATDLYTAIRLLRVGSKPIDMMVDITNYVMLDIGHPMHVYDSSVFEKNEVIVRMAKKNERLKTLDGENIKLQTSNLVITNDRFPVALAGIIGGFNSSYSSKTKSILFEAGGFNAASIRKTAAHFGIRTEASTRFEKNLDGMQNIIAIKRSLFLAKKFGLLKNISGDIVSVGEIRKPIEISITHSFIETHIGSKFSEKFIKNILGRLGFTVFAKKSLKDTTYKVEIPTTRTTKDIGIKEDILEEIVRMHGYENLDYEPLKRDVVPFSNLESSNISRIKKYLAFGCKMRELNDYLFYDESFIERLNFDPKNCISLKNPGSQNWRRLVSSLVPHFIKNIELNKNKSDILKFFEWNQIWSKSGKNLIELSSLAGAIYTIKPIDFYDQKKELKGLWDLLGIDVSWKKASSVIPAWYDKNKTADLFVGKEKIGVAGIASTEFIRPILKTGKIFLFEFDGKFLKELNIPDYKFKAWSKYQDVSYDMSLLVPLDVTSDQIKSSILSASTKVVDVELLDFFEKDDWNNKRSLTYRYKMVDYQKTLEKKDLELIVAKVEKAVKEYGVEIR